METAPNKKKENHQQEKPPSTFKPARAKTGRKNILLQRETMIFVAGIIIALLVLTFVFSFLWGKFTVWFYWVLFICVIFFTRRTDAWKMGIEVHFALTFYSAFAFGPLFAITMVLIPYALVWKVRPDEGNGVMIQMVTLSLMIGLARLFHFIYGAGITGSEFMIAFIVSIVIVQLTDGVLSKMFCPSHIVKILVIHTLDILLNSYAATLIGYKAITYFISLA